MEEAWRVEEMQTRLVGKVDECGSTGLVLEKKEAASKEMVCRYSSLEFELGADRTAIDREEKVMQDFAECVRTVYSSLLRAQLSSYRVWLSTLLVDAQSCKEYLGRYRIRVGEAGYSLYVGDVNGNGDQQDSTPRLRGDGDVVAISQPSSGL